MLLILVRDNTIGYSRWPKFSDSAGCNRSGSTRQNLNFSSATWSWILNHRANHATARNPSMYLQMPHMHVADSVQARCPCQRLSTRCENAATSLRGDMKSTREDCNITCTPSRLNVSLDSACRWALAFVAGLIVGAGPVGVISTNNPLATGHCWDSC